MEMIGEELIHREILLVLSISVSLRVSVSPW
jgi:hypothetical protein